MRFGWLNSAALGECAFQRLDQALILLDSGLVEAWPLVAYTSGVAVECAVRARRKVVSNNFNSGHHLSELATEANYSSRLRGESLPRFNADLGQADRPWDNLLRYCSASAYLEFLDRRIVKIETPYGRVKSSELSERVGETETARRFAEETYVVSARLVRYGESFWRDR